MPSSYEAFLFPTIYFGSSHNLGSRPGAGVDIFVTWARPEDNIYIIQSQRQRGCSVFLWFVLRRPRAHLSMRHFLLLSAWVQENVSAIFADNSTSGSIYVPTVRFQEVGVPTGARAHAVRRSSVAAEFVDEVRE